MFTLFFVGLSLGTITSPRATTTKDFEKQRQETQKPGLRKKRGKNMKYDYLEAIKYDIKNYIELDVNLGDYEDRDELETALNDDLWVNDSVTGNASGSYTFNTVYAKKYVLENIELAVEAYEEFCDDIGRDLKEGNWEKMDVTIRCYLLGQALNEVLDELEETGELENN